jgi:branched-chain amino acid transport system ATP-binding protein
LYEVDLDVQSGETVAIIGANGAGKTTLLRTIAGVLRPRRGEILFQGRSITGRAPHELCRAGIAMVPEGRAIFPSLNVDENLRVGAFSGRRGAWTAGRVYDLFPRLRERVRVSGIDLSGGEQQMLAIGRALMSNPDVILMDEISLGLAPLIVKELYRVVVEISSSGTTVLLVEQDVTRSLKVADRVYCLLEGRINLQGRPSELTHDQISRAYFGV